MANKPGRELIGTKITVRGHIDRVTYREANYAPGGFAIFRFICEKIEDGELPIELAMGDTPLVNFSGKAPSLSTRLEYEIRAELMRHEKFGFQYRILCMTEHVSFTNKSDVEKFFAYILPELTAKRIIDSIEDPIGVLDSGDIQTLVRVPGVGLARATKILEQYNASKMSGKAYVALYDYGLTQLMIKKLVETYGSPEVLISKIRENPYTLVYDVKGIGWLKADQIAHNIGIEQEDPRRAKAYIYYILINEGEENGSTFMSIEDIVERIAPEFPTLELDQIRMHLLNLIKEGRLYYEKETRRIGLTEYHTIEQQIAKEIKRIASAKTDAIYLINDAIKFCEEDTGFVYSDEQRKTIYDCLSQNINIVSGMAGCVDCDTEFLTEHGWKKISEYQAGDKVLCWNDSGDARFYYPCKYIKQPSQNLWHVHTKYGIDMCVSDDHRCVYYTQKGVLKVEDFETVKRKHEENQHGLQGYFVSGFNYNGKGIELTDNEIKLMLAVICDGSFQRKTPRCRFHLKKERKKEELRKICEEAGVVYKEVKSAAEGYTDFYLTAPLRDKVFKDFWYQCNQHQLKLICDNVLKWDGSCDKRGRRRFSTTAEETADFIQFAFAATGHRAVKIVQDRKGKLYSANGKLYTRKNIEYCITITDKGLAGMGGFHKNNPNKTKINAYTPIDGYQYCFGVPTERWVSRRNGKILIQGNCGKSSVMYPVVKAIELNRKYVAQCALSGKAALNLTEITHQEGRTIHRLLGYNPDSGAFEHNSTNPLAYDMIILDETSMVDEGLFLSLLKAIPNGCRLILLGDTGQLEPIGIGCVFRDLIGSKCINHNHFTKIFRQAQRSGIISEAAKVYSGEAIMTRGKKQPPVEIRGELQDFKIISLPDPKEGEYLLNVVKEYKRFMDEYGATVYDIAIVTGKRAVGETSTRSLNAAIQKLVNGATQDNEIMVAKKDGVVNYTVTFRVGDRVLVTRNCYTTTDLEGRKSPVFNGNIGTVLEIEEEGMIIKFLQGDIFYPNSKYQDLELGYAITCHKMQGAGIPYVITVCDWGSYTLLSKEWLYTAITRARKFNTLIAQPGAVIEACGRTSVLTKKTWLKDLLMDEFDKI